MSAQPAWFITGTDTEIGKTLVSGALLHALGAQGLRAAGMKPVAAGATLHADGVWHNEDADCLAAAASLAMPPALATPYLLREAAAPHIAAAMENTAIDLDHICSCYRRIAEQADAVVVEGVGGFCVPLSASASTADFAQRLGLPVILVVGLRLGCINHALLTVEAIAARGLVLAGWVANQVDATMLHVDANIDALRARLPAPLLGHVPRLPAPAPAAAAHARSIAAAAHLDFSLLPAWPTAAPVSVSA